MATANIDEESLTSLFEDMSLNLVRSTRYHAGKGIIIYFSYKYSKMNFFMPFSHQGNNNKMIDDDMFEYKYGYENKSAQIVWICSCSGIQNCKGKVYTYGMDCWLIKKR